MSTRYPFTIEHVERGEDGHWTAQLTIYGETTTVDRSQGSWRFTPANRDGWQELPLRYAVALRECVRRLERAERRESTA